MRGADPERAAEGGERIIGVDVRAMSTLEQREVLRLAPEHVGRDGQELDIRGAQRLRSVGRRQGLMRLRPRSAGVSLSSSSSVGASVRHDAVYRDIPFPGGGAASLGERVLRGLAGHGHASAPGGRT